MTKQAAAFREKLIEDEKSPSTVRGYCSAVDLFLR